MASKLKVDTVESVSTNGDITLDPNGTGDVVVASGHKLGVNTTSPQSDLSVKVSASRQLDVIKDSGDDHLVLKSSAPDASYNMRSIELAGEKVAFSTGASSGTSYTERMQITSAGTVKIGALTNSKWELRTPTDGAYVLIDHATNAGTGYSYFVFRYNGTSIGGIAQNGTTAVSFNTTSDHRLKENVTDMSGAIARVKSLSPKRFNFIGESNRTVDGFLAHEAQTVVPEAITGTHNEVDDDGNAVMQSIDQSKLVPLLTGALKEAITKIEALEARVTALEDA